MKMRLIGRLTHSHSWLHAGPGSEDEDTRWQEVGAAGSPLNISVHGTHPSSVWDLRFPMARRDIATVPREQCER